MTHVKKEHLVASPEWWRHLRPFVKRRHRKASKREADRQRSEMRAP
jgi:hypothetical protein